MTSRRASPSLVASILALSATTMAASAPAHAQVVADCDDTATLPTLDGSIAAGEYAMQANGAGNGFGSMIGTGVETYLDSDATGALAIAIDATGGNCALGADDSIVFYLDTVPGVGFADTSIFTDRADQGRAAASGQGTDGSIAQLTFAAGFEADFALVVRADSVSLFDLERSAPHRFVRTATRAPDATFASACVRELGGITMTDLGSQAGNPVRFVATLLNASNGFRSNELVGVATAPAANIGAMPYIFAAGDRSTFETQGIPVAMTGPFVWIDHNAFAGGGFSPTPTCGQLSSNSWIVSGVSDAPGTLAFGATATSGDFARGVSGDGATAGGVQAFTPRTLDRGLGLLGSTSDLNPGTVTLRVQNPGSTAIASVDLSYVVAYLNTQARATNFDLAWSTDGATFTTLSALRVTSPEAATGATWTITPRASSVPAVVPPGGYLYLRWTYSDASTSGSRDKFALDDIVIRPMYTTCGDGTMQAGETCDAGAMNGTTTCGCQWTCGFAPMTTVCAAAGAGACDAPDTCDGAGACAPRVDPMGTECRASAGPCDVAEACNGTTDTCPDDLFSMAGTVCAMADPMQPCDAPDVCDGATAACPALIATMGTVCRTTAGDCDVAEVCNGADTTCPTDGFATMGTSCRAATGDCDVAESCTGTAADCPSDTFVMMGVQCRASMGVCDVAESCSGSSGGCPADGFAMMGTVCRMSAGACDVAETCSGMAASCPANGFATDGTSCADGTACDGTERCMSGSCVDGMAVDCGDANACTTDACSEPGGTCGHTMIAGCCNLAADCNDADVCTTDTCSGPGGTCSHSEITDCCETNADCMDASACTADVCNTATNRCMRTPIPGCCATAADCNDGNACTTDACGAGGNCTQTPIAGCCATAGDCDDGDVCTTDACTSGMCTQTPIASCCEAAGDCNDGDACTTDRCDTSTQRCAADPLDCDDGDACTMDSCSAGTCTNAPICDGGVESDAGVTEDASMPTDASTGTDAGRSDAGGRDAGRADAGGELSGSSGGCACSTTGQGGSEAPFSLAALAMLGAALTLRRRRR